MSQPKLHPRTIIRRRRALLRQRNLIVDEIRALCLRCSHGAVHYSRDPSGNNDSSYDCSACGASWHNWPEGVER